MGGTEKRAGAAQDRGLGGVISPDPEGEGDEGAVGLSQEAVQETLGWTKVRNFCLKIELYR